MQLVISNHGFNTIIMGINKSFLTSIIKIIALYALLKILEYIFIYVL